MLISSKENKLMKKIDILFLIFLPIFATYTTLVMELNYFWAILVFFGPSAVWFSLRTPRMFFRTALFSAIVTPPFAIIANYLAVNDGAWYVPTTIFPFRILELLPFEDIIILFLIIHGAIITYEHFLDKGKHRLIDEKIKYFIWPMIIVFILFFMAFFLSPELLKIKYAYAWCGIIFGIPPILSTLWFFPRLMSKYIKIGSYYIILLFLFEFTGITLNHWVFEGQNYIGWVPFLGYRIPLEELLFWIIISVVAILSYYEFFDDDRK